MTHDRGSYGEDRRTRTKGGEQSHCRTPNSDFYELADVRQEDAPCWKQVRAFMETKVAKARSSTSTGSKMPSHIELLPAVIKGLNLGGVGMQGYGCRGGSDLRRPDRDGDVARRLRRSRPSSASTTAWPWARSTPRDRKSRSRNGCRRWLPSRRSAWPRPWPSRWWKHRSVRRPLDALRNERVTPGSCAARRSGIRQLALVRHLDHLGRATSPTIRSRASSSRTRPRRASASRRSRTRSRLKVVQNGSITARQRSACPRRTTFQEGEVVSHAIPRGYCG